MTHDVKIVVQQDRCEPDIPPPGTQQEPCEADVQLAGKLTMECCCPRLYTRTQIVNIGPQSEASLINFLQGTVNAYETTGYLVLAHSLIDTGAGWALGLTVGWYAP